MRIGSEREYHQTQAKLADLTLMIRRIEGWTHPADPATAASLRSLHAYANPLIEELCEYEVAHGLKPDVARGRELLPR